VLSARAINPFTKVLQFLFWPPLVGIVLSVVALTQWWVLGVRGLDDAAHQAFARPELLLVLGALMVASAVFHEFGHASALRFGGGQVRGMGVGLYLVYPALYTDVTDSYRLDRRSRVRTDLGGVYFNLIFALAVLGVYALTRQPFLLLFIPLTDLAILDEFSPFLRFDGYWALADLTGLPDFFTLIGPFVRSMLPMRWRGRGVRLPELKRWVRVVFAVYIVITVPVVATLFVFLAITAPAIISLTVQALSQESASFIVALQSGAIGEVALSILRMGTLALPALGLVVSLYFMARRLVRLAARLGSRLMGHRLIRRAFYLSLTAIVLLFCATIAGSVRTDVSPATTVSAAPYTASPTASATHSTQPRYRISP